MKLSKAEMYLSSAEKIVVKFIANFLVSDLA